MLWCHRSRHCPRPPRLLSRQTQPAEQSLVLNPQKRKAVKRVPSERNHQALPPRLDRRGQSRLKRFVRLPTAQRIRCSRDSPLVIAKNRFVSVSAPESFPRSDQTVVADSWSRLSVIVWQYPHARWNRESETQFA